MTFNACWKINSCCVIVLPEVIYSKLIFFYVKFVIKVEISLKKRMIAYLHETCNQN